MGNEGNKKKSSKKNHTKNGLYKIAGAILTAAAIVIEAKNTKK